MTYLDHAASTPMRASAREAWLDATAVSGNASSGHASGRHMRRILEDAREQIAEDLAVDADRVVFTSGGTESDNIAVTGAFVARRHADPQRRVIVLSRIEHKAVIEPAEHLEQEGAELEWLDVDATGAVSPDQLREILNDRGDEVALVAVMWANNEVGAVQPIAELAVICAEYEVPLHCDAVQALGNVAVRAELPTTAAFTAHKVGGPVGIGLLLVDPKATVEPLLRGGGQELGMRAGSSNVAGAAAAAAAIHEAVTEQQHHAERMANLRDQLLRGVAQQAAGTRPFDYVVNSSEAGLPGLLNISFPGCDGDALMMLLDDAGISVSTGSACNVGIPKPSYVLTAMGTEHTTSTLRISLGWSSGSGDVAALLTALPAAVTAASQAGASAGAAR